MTRAPGPHPLPVFLAALQGACAGDSARLAAALAGLARYQQAARPPPLPPRPEVARVGGVTLRGRIGPRPLVMVPSLINPPDVLDLPGRSLFAHFEAAGLDPLLVDWGPQPEPLGLADLVRERLAPLVQSLAQPVGLMGYCLGGTLALALAGQVAATRLALIATPWNFAGYDAAARAGLARWWASAEPLAQTMGQLPIDLLQPAFWSLDPAGLAAKYERLATADAATLADFVRLEDWANGGAPLSLAVAHDMAALFGGQAATLAPVPAIPILDAVALSDRIVPAAAALSPPGSASRLDIAGGHVGMVVGRQAPDRLWAALTTFFAAEQAVADGAARQSGLGCTKRLAISGEDP
ncbi:alpha/beta hydrolase [Sandarakinorhabdus sp. AAP62]|uniref:alpha/beta hydrolase n=1 Tax=Sandarakinorhabdus sp. AAP62 TaxID=1248916 RepID=UPI0002EAC3F8|nr:alpha/beta hydrolase [Sandarakinorhabdus sp. AAP62]